MLTTDEYTPYPSSRRDSSSLDWEYLDYYMPNGPLAFMNDPIKRQDTLYQVNELFTHRLNYRHRNRPRYVGVDPNRFQGAFVRIWNADSVGSYNNLSDNGRNRILNAYDVEENNIVGYIGNSNIPKVANVPGVGAHEPYIIGNRLYLASYNAGSRILDLRGDQMKLLAYCDTEAPLDTNINSDNWYARGDILMYAKGIYRLVPDPWRSGIIYGSDLFNGMFIQKFYDSTIVDTIKHDSFQPFVEIGTIDCNNRLTFTVTRNAIVASGSIVKLVDCTKMKFDSSKKIFVDGELHIGAVDFDTTNLNALSNIVVHAGGKAYIGADDKTINGFHTMTIDSGGIAYIQGGVLNFMRGGIINVYGELQINSVTLNDQSRIVCKPGGKVVICSTATVSGVKRLTIENGGVLEVKSGSTTTLFRGGVIKIQGGVNAALSGNEWAVFDYRFNGADKWEGIVFDSIPRTSTQTRTLSNIIIQHANTGITTYSDATYKSQPTITNCTIAYNDIGITVFNDSPFLSYNKIRHNSTAGLVGYYMSTIVEGNRIDSNGTYGAKLYHCGNLWIKNIVDSNAEYGIFADELVTVPFNRYIDSLPDYTCDTTQGNSLRYNHNGLHVDDLSHPTFQCDNSVHDNSNYDFIILGTASVIGYANYPDSTQLKVYRPFTKNTTFIWSDESPNETVFSKSSQSLQNAIDQRQPFDDRFKEAMNNARIESRHRRYSFATMHFKDALKYVHERWEAEQCLVEWQQALQDAKLNRPSKDPISQGVISGGLELIGTLFTLRNSDVPKWLKNTCNEFLADQYMRDNLYSDALPLYEDFVSQQKDEPVLARRALMALVILKHRGLRDYESAYKIYEEIERLYPRTYAVVFAKIDLGLPLSDDDLEIIKSIPPIEKLNANNNDENRKVNVPREYALHQCYPNPFNPSTTIKYELPFSSKVNLKVFNSLGVEVKTLIDKEEPAGLHSVAFDGSTFSSGIYIYRLNVENLVTGEKKIFEKKMSLLK